MQSVTGPLDRVSQERQGDLASMADLMELICSLMLKRAASC
jgi:hypothetical protein